MKENTKEPTFIYYFPRDSIFIKIPFAIKLVIFLLISTLSLISQNIILLFAISLFISITIFITRFPLYNFRPLKLILISIFIFSIFWILFSNVPGDKIYFKFKWGTSISNVTLEKMFLAIGKWSCIVLIGLLFIITTSEKQLLNLLIKIKLPKKLILTLTISFNTLAFLMEDFKNIEHSILSRNIKSKGLFWKIKRKYLLGSTLFLSNIKRIDSLYQSYLYRSK